MADQDSKIIISTFEKGMHSDAPLSMQPQSTYREAWGVVNSTDTESGFGVASEASNIIHTLIPEGSEIRGMAYAEERDWLVLFLHNIKENLSEIGIIDEKTKTYRTVVNDTKLPDGKLCFGEELINVELKVEQPCNELHAYWSNNYTYRYLNLEVECCDYKLADMELFRCICGPIIEPVIQEGGGTLANGAYQFAAQLEDKDGNQTNWFKVSQPVYVAEQDFVAGEPTRRSIRIDLSDLDTEYEQVNIAVIKTIGGQTFPPEVIFKRNYASGKVSVVYNGQKGDSLPFEAVLVKNPSYIRGRNLFQHDGRLILYNVLGETNLEYQHLANQIEVNYAVGLVPAEDAHAVKTMRRDENYMLGIRWNYCDGTSSADFVIPGRRPTPEEAALVPDENDENCASCVKPFWDVYNTAKRFPNPNNPFDDEYYIARETSAIFKGPGKKVEYQPPSYEEETEEVVIPPALEDILNHDPNELTADICACLEDLIKIKGTVTELGSGGGGLFDLELSKLRYDLSIGISTECCARLQDTLSTFGGGFGQGFNEIIGSLEDYLHNDDGDQGGGGGGTDPGLNCSSYSCRNNPCPDGCECSDEPNYICGNGAGFTAGLQDGDLPPGYVPPSTTVTASEIQQLLNDITVEDLDGNLLNIKDLNDAGKTVYLKAFTTWCGPCYVQHTSSIVDDFYSAYGPAGMDTVQVIGIEFDPATTDAQIEGIGSGTQGDFTTAGYPIVNAGADLIEILAANYNVSYFPQIIAIYPDGSSQTINPEDLEASAMAASTIPSIPSSSCSSCSGNVGKCTGTGSCSEPLPFDSCYECNEDDYCRFTCYKQPQTFLQAIQNLLFHVTERRKRRKYYKYHGTIVANDAVPLAAIAEGGEDPVNKIKYAKIRVYSDDGCEVVDKLYPIVAEGKLGVWQSSEIYPLTKDCNGNFLFGELAGTPVKLHRIPDSAIEPHFVSYHDGVVNASDASGYELQDTFIRPIWLTYKGITLPENPPKPLCPNNPFTITYVKRDPTNKRVLASGMFTHTFLGNVFGKDYVFPKHAVNSLEYIDRNIYNEIENTTDCGNATCLYNTDCNPGCECDGALPDPGIRYCQPAETPSCAGNPCDPAVGCGEDCDCLPTSDVTCSNSTCTLQDCPEGCECYDPCGGTPCSTALDCSGPDCFCNFDNPLDPFGVCTTSTVTGDLLCRNIYVCVPKPECEAIPCTTDAECPENCPTCPPPGGTPGNCRPIDNEKKGKPNDFPIYNFHSPDTSFDRPFLGGSNRSAFDLQLFGWGFRHGQYAEGEEPKTITEQQIDQRGTRQSVNLNHYLPIIGPRQKCVAGITYAEADSIVDANEGFTFEQFKDGKYVTVPAPLMNRFRESSVFVQFEGNYVNPLNERTRADLLNTDTEYRTDDASFIGDGTCHECIVPRAGAWYGSLLHHRSDQYGSVEGIRMIPTGTEGTMGDALRGRVTGSSGDAYIGPWTLVRKSYISNKVGDNIEPRVSSALKRFLCFGDCSKLPISCNAGDPKNRANLRPWFGDRSGNKCPGWYEAFFRDSIRDRYYPRTLKTLIVTWVEADSNTWFRELGDPDNFELAYPRLKNKPLDSSLTQEHYDQAFLNHFAARHERIPQWKLLAKILLRAAAFIVPLLWFINGGFKISADYTDIFLIAVRIALFVALYLILTLVLFTCANINRMLNIYQCKNDEQGAPEEENVYGFRDNYTRYNYDYSLTNDIDQGFSVTSSYDTRPCVGEETNKIVYSNKQVVGSPVNAWRNFHINNYLELPFDTGAIQDIFVIGNRMFVQTTDNIWNLNTHHEELALRGDGSIYLGTGSFMRQADALYGGVREGNAGTLDPNASVNSKFGHISVDREARKVNFFDGQSSVPISDLGLKHFMRENLNLRLVDQFPGFSLVDKKIRYGVGYSIGVDNELNRILITKIDYEAYDPSKLTLSPDGRYFINEKGERVFAGDPAYFCNKSFTASYSFETKTWVSFHYYTPNWYSWNRFTLYSFDRRAMWEHNVVGSFSKFYDTQYPIVLEVVATDPRPFRYHSSVLDTEASRWVGDGMYVHGVRRTFDKIMAYNRHQNTGMLDFSYTDEKSIVENSTQDDDTVDLKYTLPRWTFSDLKDKLISSEDVMFDRVCSIAPKTPNKQNLSLDITNQTLVDNYLVYSLHSSTFEDVKLIVRGVITIAETEDDVF